jgi:membrane-associated protein
MPSCSLIVFAETGFVVTPFLPGDSLLFVAGALCGAGSMDLWNCSMPR